MADTRFLADKVLALHDAPDNAGVSHAFGGALALAYCIEEPRGTADIDLNVFADPDQVEAVLRALPEGVAFDDRDVELVRSNGQTRVRWGETPVDLFFACHEFHTFVAARIRLVPFDNTTIPILDCSDLAVFKAMFGRNRDWADIEAAVIAGTIDGEYALGWIAKLLGVDSPSYSRLSDTLEAEAELEPIAKDLFRI